MHRLPLAERGGIRVPDTPREAGAGDCVVLAIDQIAQTTDGQAKRDADDGHVEHEPDREPQTPCGDETGE